MTGPAERPFPPGTRVTGPGGRTGTVTGDGGFSNARNVEYDTGPSRFVLELIEGLSVTGPAEQSDAQAAADLAGTARASYDLACEAADEAALELQTAAGAYAVAEAARLTALRDYQHALSAARAEEAGRG